MVHFFNNYPTSAQKLILIFLAADGVRWQGWKWIVENISQLFQVLSVHFD